MHVTAEFKDTIVQQRALILLGDFHVGAVEAIMSKGKHCVQVIGIIIIILLLLLQ